MRIKRALITFFLLTGLYLVALIWADSRNHVFAGIPKLWSAMPVLLSASLLSFFMRYARWNWLLSRAGSKTTYFPGFLAYLSGFAFTATPGKVGELLRIRYLAPQGVPPWKVLAAFVYERAFDLLAVLILASLYISRIDVFVFVTGFVTLLLGAITFIAFHPVCLTRLAAYLRSTHIKRGAIVVETLRDGLSGCRLWFNPLDAVVSLGFGLAAWGLTALSFVYLLRYLEIVLPATMTIAIYPLAMLAGAASMLPGGIGSTEVTIMVILSMQGIPVGVAALAAVGIRLSTLWYAIACGFLSLGILEVRGVDYFDKRITLTRKIVEN